MKIIIAKNKIFATELENCFILRSIFYGTRLTKVSLLFVCLCLLKINTVFSQGISFSVNSLPSVGLVYENEVDFEEDRVIPDAIQLNIRARNRQLIIQARTIPTLNNAVTRMPNDVFAIQLTNTNANVEGSYYNKQALSNNDRIVLRNNFRGNRSYFFNYDLHFRAIGYEYDPGQYMYSVIFTISSF